jgi:hypothetical protein
MKSTDLVMLLAAARIGKAILLDHGTGVVIGETAIIGDRVSILQVIEEACTRHWVLLVTRGKRKHELSLNYLFISLHYYWMDLECQL